MFNGKADVTGDGHGFTPSGHWRHAAAQRNPALRCQRAQRDSALTPHIERVWHANMQVYGADKVWKQMDREGITVARCAVERLMRRLGLQGEANYWRHLADQDSMAEA